MPAGLLVTVPLPVPALATLRVKVEAGCRLKVAVQLRFALIVTITAAVVAAQPVPAQAAKTEPDVGAAVNVAVVPLLKVPEQLVEQLIPAGELVMVPPPVPALVAVRLKVTTGGKLKVAVQLRLALRVTVTAGVVAAQPVPVQLAKAEPVAGAAVNVTAVPLLKVPEQVVEQLIPAGELVMVPLPVPALVTARVKVCTGAAGVPQTSAVYVELPAVLYA
jgi:hypothetical protein